MKNDNLKLWDAVGTTRPEHTKPFNRGGGFKGTAINATSNVMRATEVWGKCGDGWGYDVEKEDFIEGAPILNEAGAVVCRDLIHKVYISLWYMEGEKVCKVHHFGQTQFVGKNKNGIYTDEEAPKKSLTDAIGKCLSMLGFGADIYLGMYDDHKYVNDLKVNGDDKAKQEVIADDIQTKISACKTSAEIAALWKTEKPRMENLTNGVLERVKEHFGTRKKYLDELEKKLEATNG